MPMPAEQIESHIRKRFPDAEITLIDTAGDQDHYALTVISEAFRNKNRVQQHKMVYDALEGHMATTLHALQIKTLPPQEEKP